MSFFNNFFNKGLRTLIAHVGGAAFISTVLFCLSHPPILNVFECKPYVPGKPVYSDRDYFDTEGRLGSQKKLQLIALPRHHSRYVVIVLNGPSKVYRLASGRFNNRPFASWALDQHGVMILGATGNLDRVYSKDVSGHATVLTPGYSFSYPILIQGDTPRMVFSLGANSITSIREYAKVFIRMFLSIFGGLVAFSIYRRLKTPSSKDLF